MARLLQLDRNNRVYQRFNALFEWLPIAAVIDSVPEPPTAAAAAAAAAAASAAAGSDAAQASTPGAAGRLIRASLGGLTAAVFPHLSWPRPCTVPVPAPQLAEAAAKPRRVFCVHGGVGSLQLLSQLDTEASPIHPVRVLNVQHSEACTQQNARCEYLGSFGCRLRCIVRISTVCCAYRLPCVHAVPRCP